MRRNFLFTTNLIQASATNIVARCKVRCIMQKIRYLTIQFGLAALSLFGVFMCLCWYPFSTAVNLGYIMPDAIVETWKCYSIYAFYILASLPCFGIVILLSRGVRALYKSDDVEMISNALRRSSRILLVDLVFFLVGNVVLSIVELNTYAVIYYAMIVVGLAIVFAFSNKAKKMC